jgi:hypothetical protein
MLKSGLTHAEVAERMGLAMSEGRNQRGKHRMPELVTLEYLEGPEER